MCKPYPPADKQNFEYRLSSSKCTSDNFVRDDMPRTCVTFNDVCDIATVISQNLFERHAKNSRVKDWRPCSNVTVGVWTKFIGCHLGIFVLFNLQYVHHE